ncbi:MAG: OmpA family protein [Myxococcaceae bacterium]
MLLSRREINVWPAFADMTFMLAVTLLVIAGGVFALVQSKEAELKLKEDRVVKLNERLLALGVDPETQDSSCGLATPVVEAMAGCLAAAHLRVEKRACSLSVEDAVRFRSDESRLEGKALENAKLIARCIIVGTERLIAADAQMNATIKSEASFGLDSISIEGHADRCGYGSYDNLERSMNIPYSRAKAVYALVFRDVQRATLSREYKPEQAAAILSRIAVRSFGPYRPLSKSSCTCGTATTSADGLACAADRRVEIVVQGRVGSAESNWGPVRSGLLENLTVASESPVVPKPNSPEPAGVP